jgi:hypothetical protein
VTALEMTAAVQRLADAASASGEDTQRGGGIMEIHMKIWIQSDIAMYRSRRRKRTTSVRLLRA